MPKRNLCLRTDGAAWTRGDKIAEAMGEAFGIPVTRSRALDLALQKGLDMLEAEFGIAPTKKSTRKRKARKR